MDTDIPQYCRRCGTMLVDGVCPTCPAQAPAPAPAPRPAKPAAATLTAVAAPAPSVYHAPARSEPHHEPSQPEPHHEWFSSVPEPPVPKRGMGWRYNHMWNWGAFLLCPLWLMNHGRIWRAMLFLVLCAVPLLWVFALAMAIAYGIKGNRVASISRDFVDDAQFIDVQNTWRNFGFGVVLVVLALVLVVGYATAISVPRTDS